MKTDYRYSSDLVYFIYSGGLQTIVQSNLEKLLAYSSVENIGIIV